MQAAGASRTTLLHHAGSCAAARRACVHSWKAAAPRSKRAAQPPALSMEEQEAFLAKVRKEHNVGSIHGWKNVSKKDVLAMDGGRAFLSAHGGSLRAALTHLLPEVEESETEWTNRLPSGYWESQEHREKFLLALAKRHAVASPADWRHVRVRDIRRMGGSGLLHHCKSLSKALSMTFPGQFPYPASTTRKGPQHWAKAEHRKQFVDQLAADLDIRQAEDWKRVTYETVLEQGGGAVLQHYGNSVYAMLRETVPDMAVSATACRPKVPKDYWRSVENRRVFLDEVKEKMGVEEQGDWARVSQADIRSLGGSSLSTLYGGSLYKMLSETYVEEDWHQFLCRPLTPQGYWQSSDNVRAFLEHAREALSITSPEDWGRVSREELKAVPGGGSFVHQRLRLQDALTATYPDVDWDAIFSDSTALKKSTQRQVRLCMAQLFPNQRIVEDYQQSGFAVIAKGRALELDIFLPDLRLAVEFNGEHHYEELPFFAPLEVVQRRDAEKLSLCEAAGIKLVTVPYWWDKQLPSLAATLHQQHPGILCSQSAQ